MRVFVCVCTCACVDAAGGEAGEGGVRDTLRYVRHY